VIAPAVTIDIDAPAQLFGSWDRSRLDQVVTNLVTNAIKYGQGKPVTISVGVEADRSAVLRVADRGIGVPAEAQTRIFQRFERATPSTDYGGIGLGLWIAREIVEASGGRIDLSSEPGMGSTFTVVLPIAAPQGSS